MAFTIPITTLTTRHIYSLHIPTVVRHAYHLSYRPV